MKLRCGFTRTAKGDVTSFTPPVSSSALFCFMYNCLLVLWDQSLCLPLKQGNWLLVSTAFRAGIRCRHGLREAGWSHKPFPAPGAHLPPYSKHCRKMSSAFFSISAAMLCYDFNRDEIQEGAQAMRVLSLLRSAIITACRHSVMVS